MSRVEPSICPNCKCVLDGAASLMGAHTPSEGDFSVCAYCTSINIFGPKLQLRVATKEELENVSEGLRLTLTRAQDLIKKKFGKRFWGIN